ncbi:MAG: hypothetical protein JO108_11540 [Acidobacteriaceae bacterium]|nr:hypothetical protein [Acidobacteriaceae bacterium]
MAVLRILPALLFALLSIRASTAAGNPELWYFYHNELDSDDSLRAARALIDRAAGVGYNGLVLWCGNTDRLGTDDSPLDVEDRMKGLLKYAASKQFKVAVTAVPFSNSVNALRWNPNWAESQRIVGAQFRVDAAKKRLDLMNSFAGLQNSGFESGQTGWFDTGDAGLHLDNQMARSGHASAVIDNAKGNARLRQRVKLEPWRQYHLRLSYRSQDFRGYSQLEVLEASDLTKVRFYAPVRASGTNDWRQVDYVFDSGDTTDAYIYTGVWGGNGGKLWFDDIELAETALVYVTRRPGTPLKVYDPKNPATVFQEGSDYEPIFDPRMRDPHPFTDSYHDPGPVNLTKKTSLSPGQIVAMDFYAAFPIPGTEQVSMCLTDAGVAEWIKRNAHGVRKVLPKGGGVLLSYDEMRQMNSCGSCRARKVSAGQLLAWNVGQTASTYDSEAPNAPLYIWNDMFDPNHNAVKNYYFVEGDLAGSWKGLRPDMTIMNWNLEKLHKSLEWFAGLDRDQPVALKQIIAGYYDTGDGAGAARQELEQAAGIPGIQGLMYTTWNDDYSQLENFANAVKAGWPAYERSPKRTGTASLVPVSLMLLGAAFAGSLWKVRSGKQSGKAG